MFLNKTFGINFFLKSKIIFIFGIPTFYHKLRSVMKAIYLLFFILFLVLTSPASAQDSTMKVIGPGIKFHSVKKPGPYNIKILEIDISQPQNKIESVLAKDVMGTGFEKTTSMAKRNSYNGHIVMGAINGDYFGISYPDSPHTFLNSPMIMNREYVMGKSVVRTSFSMTETKKPIFDILGCAGTVRAGADSIYTLARVNQSRATNQLVIFNKYFGASTRTNTSGMECRMTPIDTFRIGSEMRFRILSKENGVGNMPIQGEYVLSGHGLARTFLNTNVNAGDTVYVKFSTTPNVGALDFSVGGGPRLVTNGTRPSTFVGVEGFGESHVNTQHPRTALGISQDSTKVYFITVDGRQPSLSVGMSCAQLADYMIFMGCYHGYNLDGGGSTTMVARGVIQNSPSDGSERSCGNALIAVSEINSTDYIDSFYLTPRMIIIDSTQTKKININAIDLWGYPIDSEASQYTWNVIGIDGYVDSSGTFHPVNSGEGKIVAEINGISDTINVTVLSERVPTWTVSASQNNLPAWFSTTGNTERGMAYGYVNNLHRLYIVNRPNISIIEPATGDVAGTISTSGITGGTYTVNDIETSTDGKIFVGNLTTDASTSAFKVYRFDSETSAPVVVVNYTGTAIRLGDKFTVVGSWKDSTAVLYAMGNGTGTLLKWTMVNGTFTSTPQTIYVTPTATGTNTVAYPKGLGSSNFFVNGNSIRPSEYTPTGTLVSTLPAGLVDTRSSAMRYIDTPGRKYLIVFQYGFPNENAVVLDVTGGLANATVLESTPSLGTNTNTTAAAGDISFREYGPNRYLFYVLSTNNGYAAYQIVNDVTEADESAIPTEYNLEQNYPNPFNPTTKIRFSLPVSSNVSLKVYDILGNEVSTLVNEDLPAGSHSIEFSGKGLATGVYIYRLQTGEYTNIKKMMLLK